MIVLPGGIYDQCCKSGRQAYPLEGCGLLLAKSDDMLAFNSKIQASANRSTPPECDVHIAELLVAENIAPPDLQRRRYQLDPRYLLAVQRRCRERKQEIIGIFHTHPDHPPVPSAADLAAAWPVYVYLILHVRADAFGSIMAWKLDANGEKFYPVAVLA